ncbi:MAG: hypothetical protein OXD47_00925 [Gammaproteobacteria bacterium]|nr:hypothetical protein [Gammaproteobacteria bacterium]MCY4337343.1 hypothetical protein [Gammaproteobacteria bacterium]
MTITSPTKAEMPVVRLKEAFTTNTFVEGMNNVVLYHFEISNFDTARPTKDLRIGLSWMATTTGRTGYGPAGIDPIIIPAGQQATSSPYPIGTPPEDNVARLCNRFVFNLYSMQPDDYKVAPYIKGQGFDYFYYKDNDGAHNQTLYDARCK